MDVLLSVRILKELLGLCTIIPLRLTLADDLTQSYGFTHHCVAGFGRAQDVLDLARSPLCSVLAPSMQHTRDLVTHLA